MSILDTNDIQKSDQESYRQSSRQALPDQHQKCLSAKRQAGRTALTYALVSLLCIVVTEVYSLFGHGVRSAAMDLMFLLPLLGGALPFSLRYLRLRRTESKPIPRFAFNAYNSGIATLTVSRLLTGVFVIAGAANPYPRWLLLLGGFEILLAVIFVLVRQASAGWRRQSPQSRKEK